MLYYLFKILQESGFPGARLFSYTSFRALTAIVLALLISAIFGEYFIRFFKKRQISENLRDLDKNNKGLKHRIFGALQKSGIDGFRETHYNTYDDPQNTVSDDADAES